MGVTPPGYQAVLILTNHVHNASSDFSRFKLQGRVLFLLLTQTLALSIEVAFDKILGIKTVTELFATQGLAALRKFNKLTTH